MMTLNQKLHFLRQHDLLHLPYVHVLLEPTAVEVLPCELTSPIRVLMYLTVLVYGHATSGRIMIDGMAGTTLPDRHQHETSITIPVQDGVFIYITRSPFGHAATRPSPHVEATDISAEGLHAGVIAIIGIQARGL